MLSSSSVTQEFGVIEAPDSDSALGAGQKVLPAGLTSNTGTFNKGAARVFLAICVSSQQM